MADVQASLLTYLYNLLTADTALKAAMGGAVRCYPVSAPPDSAFPYLVHRIDAGPPGGIWPERNSTYQLDVWSQDPAAHDITAIRNRLVLILDELVFNTTEGVSSISDSYSLRRSALTLKIPYYTTVAGARASIASIKAVQSGGLEVAPLQSYFSQEF